MFYHYKELGYNKNSALEISKKWKSLGYRIRTTTTKERDMRGAKSGSYLKGSLHYHVWVANK